MKLTVLGSGAWEGIPTPFCYCAVCSAAVKDSRSKDNRTRPQLLVETSEGAFLLEVSPDIRLQSTRFTLPPVTDFVVSHWHFDHMYGLHELLSWSKRQERKPTVHCSIGTKEVIEKEFGYLPISLNIVKPFHSFTLAGVRITPVPVYHLFNRDDGVPKDLLENSFGYVLDYENKRVAYLGDYYRIPTATLDAVRGTDVLIADGTYLQTEDFKTTQKNHLHGADILQFTQRTKAKAVYFHSISHLTRKNHEDLQQELPPAHFLTHDWMEIPLSTSPISS